MKNTHTHTHTNETGEFPSLKYVSFQYCSVSAAAPGLLNKVVEGGAGGGAAPSRGAQPPGHARVLSAFGRREVGFFRAINFVGFLALTRARTRQTEFRAYKQ